MEGLCFPTSTRRVVHTAPCILRAVTVRRLHDGCTSVTKYATERCMQIEDVVQLAPLLAASAGGSRMYLVAMHKSAGSSAAAVEELRRSLSGCNLGTIWRHEHEHLNTYYPTTDRHVDLAAGTGPDSGCWRVVSWRLSDRCVEMVRRSPLVAYVEVDMPQTPLGVQVPSRPSGVT